MPPRPPVLKTDYPRRIVILSKRSEPMEHSDLVGKELSSPAARLPRASKGSPRASRCAFTTLVTGIGRSPVRRPSCPLLYGSRITDHGSPFCISFINTCETLATVDSKALTEMLSPLESAVTRFRAVSPLEYALTKKVGGWGPLLSTSHPSNVLTGMALLLTFKPSNVKRSNAFIGMAFLLTLKPSNVQRSNAFIYPCASPCGAARLASIIVTHAESGAPC